MAFQKPISIRQAIDHVHSKKYVLPAIQREFIWKTDQITRLFDSLMRGYPISSFLFWKVDREHCRQFKFYDFLDNYHERNQRHNPLRNLAGAVGITAILDGQQRLTSLNIGLLGSYTSKTKHKQRNNPDAYRKRMLYLNLLQPAPGEGVGLKYDFRFLTDDVAQNSDGKHWFPVGEILNFDSLIDSNRYLRKHALPILGYTKECLSNLYDAICEKKLINYYQEEDQDLDKVLNIFIRVNSGGTKLSYSDLLLSFLTVQWNKLNAREQIHKLDAREQVHKLVDDLNSTGDGFNLSKDFVLKSCLVLADISDIGFKVKNFTHANTKKIEDAWSKISEALRVAVGLASRFGYNGRTLTANNVLVPIAYYLLTRQLPEGYLERQIHADDREAVRKWIVRALLKTGTFGGSSDVTLRTARSADPRPLWFVPNPATGYSVCQDWQEHFALRKKNLMTCSTRPTATELPSRCWHCSILVWISPTASTKTISFRRPPSPKSVYSHAGVSEDQVSAFQERRDRIANLQLLEGTPNQEKSAKMPAEWLRSHFTSDDTLNGWKERNFTDDVPNDMRGFLDFYEARRKKMKARLAQVLGVNLHG